MAVEIRPAAVVPRRAVVTEVRLTRLPEVSAVEVRPDELQMTHLDPTRTSVEPLTPELRRYHVTVSKEFLAKLKRARSGQSHVQPGATDEQVLEAALDLLLASQVKRKSTVPAKVKRAVKERDRGECQWPLASGGVCGSVVRTEIDHVVPRGRGGPSTVENCRVLCKVHNLEAARHVYGDEHMDLFTRSVPEAREAEQEYGPLHVRVTEERGRNSSRPASDRPCLGTGQPPGTGTGGAGTRPPSSAGHRGICWRRCGRAPRPARPIGPGPAACRAPDPGRTPSAPHRSRPRRARPTQWSTPGTRRRRAKRRRETRPPGWVWPARKAQDRTDSAPRGSPG